jgi:hypothetical protein
MLGVVACTYHPSYAGSINRRIVVHTTSGINVSLSWALVAEACNPSYLGGRDQEDSGSKPAQANSSQDHILKIPNPKKGWWSGSNCRP